MKISTPEIYRFKHSEVICRFEGDLYYVGEMMIRGHCWAVYKADKPNYAKGHKDYMMLGEFNGRILVSGCTADEMQIERWQKGILCGECGEMLFSKFHHNYVSCSCPNHTMVDGGASYMRCGGLNMTKVIPITICALTGERK